MGRRGRRRLSREERQGKPPVVDRGGNGPEHQTQDRDQAAIRRAALDSAAIDDRGVWLRRGRVDRFYWYGRKPCGHSQKVCRQRRCKYRRDGVLSRAAVASFRFDASRRYGPSGDATVGLNQRKASVSGRDRVVRCNQREAERKADGITKAQRWERISTEDAVDRRTPPRSHDRNSVQMAGLHCSKLRK